MRRSSGFDDHTYLVMSKLRPLNVWRDTIGMAIVEFAHACRYFSSHSLALCFVLSARGDGGSRGVKRKADANAARRVSERGRAELWRHFPLWDMTQAREETPARTHARQHVPGKQMGA